MANSNGWGDGAANNTIGWGQGANNLMGWGSSELASSAGRTNIVGAFASTWTTTAPNETITLPYSGSGTYTGTIYWGDGNTDLNDGSVTTHTYTTAGTYTIIIRGICTAWDFSNLGGSTYITSVVNWGQLNIMSNGFQFADCPNLDLGLVAGILDLTGTTNLSGMFAFCTSLASVNNINLWDTTDIIQMSEMFTGATLFEQNIGSLNVANVTDFTNFMGDKTDLTFSTANLNAIYNGWSTQNVQPNINISFGTAKYTAASSAGRAILTGTKNWTITDGGI